MFVTQKFAHGGDVYAEESPVGRWLDFSANINPLGLPETVLNAILSNAPRVINYPDPSARKLYSVVAEHYHAERKGIILGNGATELFYLFFSALRPKKAIIPAPAFAEYERAALAARAEPLFFTLNEEDNFAYRAEKIPEDTQNAVIVLGNPNNPTGTLIPPAEREKILAAAQKKGAWLLIDESFLDFLTDAGEKYSFKPYVKDYPQLVVVHSLTKFFAIPGLRLGFAVAAPEFARRMNDQKDVWNVNLLAQEAGVAALADEDYIVRSRRFVAQEKDFLAASLAEIPGLTTFPPTVNFIFAKLTAGHSSAELTKKIRERGILIRDCGNYRALNGQYVRAAVRTRAENLRLVAAMKECLNQK